MKTIHSIINKLLKIRDKNSHLMPGDTNISVVVYIVMFITEIIALSISKDIAFSVLLLYTVFTIIVALILFREYKTTQNKIYYKNIGYTIFDWILVLVVCYLKFR